MENLGSATRLDRVEGEVSGLRTDMTGLKTEMGSVKADVRGLGSILGRIEAGVSKAQERADQRDERGRPNLIAVCSVLITIISILVGGAWMVSGQLARLDERSISRDVDVQRMQEKLDRVAGGHHVSATPQ